MFSAGLGMGLGAGITIGEPQTIWRLTLAGLAFVPAMAAMAGVAALAVALRHAWIGWLAVTFVIISLYLGALLRLPQWLLDASPIGQTKAPSGVFGHRADRHGGRRRGADACRGHALSPSRRDLRNRRRNHEDRTSTSGLHSLQHPVLRSAAVLAGRHVRLLAGLGFHRRVHGRRHGSHRYLALAYPDAFARRLKSGPFCRDQIGAKADQRRHHGLGYRRGGDQRPRSPVRMVDCPDGGRRGRQRAGAGRDLAIRARDHPKQLRGSDDHRRRGRPVVSSGLYGLFAIRCTSVHWS